MAILLSAGRNSNERVYFVQRKCSKGMLIMKELILRIYEHLLSSANYRKWSSIQDPRPAVWLCERHFPDRLDKPQRYKVCMERRRTRIFQKTCCPERPVDPSPVDCSSIHHTKLHESKFLTVLCDYFTKSHFISVYLCKLVWIIAWHNGHSC